MGLTKRERRILELATMGMSDYKIARNLRVNPPIVEKAHKSAQKKLVDAQKDVEWATKLGIDISEFDAEIENE